MSKNTEEQGETKSASKEIEKMATTTCAKCGLAAVRPIVVDGKCANATACGKRQRRRARLEAARAGAAGA